MNKLFFLFVASAFCVVSCSKSDDQVLEIEPVQESEEVLTPDEVLALSNYFMGSKISEQEATQSAVSIMEFLDSSSGTKGSKSRSIASCKPVTQTKETKSGTGVEDTVAYVFNFSDDGGYTILSADRRTSSVLALVPEGNIDFQGEFDENILKTGAMVFYGNLEGAYMSQIEQETENEEYLLSRALEKLSHNDSTPVTKAMIDEMELRYGPLKTELVAPVTVAVRWGQDNPYNLSTPIISGQHALNGCVATAVAQMMSYWRYPKSYEWSSMLPSFGAETYSTFQKISNLMSDVGVGVNTKYGKTSSSAYLEDVPAYMASLGFDPGTYGEFNTEQVLASLEDYYPVIVSGSALKKDVYKTYMLFWEKYSHTYYDDNHTWLVDGAIMTYRTIYVTYQGETYQFDRQNQKLLMHCNFGWPELTLDGYYDWGVFDTRQGPVTRGHTNTSGSKGYYQYNVMCITGIRRLDVTH